MSIARWVFLALLTQLPSAPQPDVPATASIEGVVVRLGTNEPISNADVELTRVAGTAAAPLSPEALEVLARALVGGGNGGPTVPPPIASEVRYFKTGADGRFSFKNLKEGKYRLVSIWIGGAYHPAEYGQRDPRGRGLNFPIAEGQTMKDARLEMAPTGSISGRVLDADGHGMGHVSVMALEPMMQNGRRYLAIMEAGHTDERGEYRLFWLSPGKYYVAARVEDMQRRSVPLYVIPPGRGGMNERVSAPVVARRRVPDGSVVEETYAIVYSGGVLSADQSQSIEIHPGQSFGGVDIPMGVGTQRAFHIRGTVLGPTGNPGAGANVSAIPRQWSPHTFIINGAADSNGVFDLAGAVQGSYYVFATAAGNLPPALAASVGPAAVASLGGAAGIGLATVDVGLVDVENVRIATSFGLTVPGRVTLEGRDQRSSDVDVSKIRVGFSRDPDIMTMPTATMPLPRNPQNPNEPPLMVSGQVLADGTFRVMAAPGDFRVTVSGIPGNTYVKSIRTGLLDVLADGLHMIERPPENPLDIVIGVDAGEVTGGVQTERSQPLPNAVVALVPESPTLRRRIDLFKSATTDSNGRFQLQTVPPGTYKLFAWEYAEADIWQDPRFLESYEALGTSITVREGGKMDVQIPVTPVRK